MTRKNIINVYIGALAITIVGSGAAWLIVDAATRLSYDEQVIIDPMDPNFDFERGRNN